MTKTRLFTIAILLLFVQSSIDAQTKKTTTKRPRAKTTKVETPKVEETEEVEEKKDTIVAVPEPEKPKYKSLNDPVVVRYLRGGFAKDNKLYLIANADYDSLYIIQKQDVLNKVAKEFAGHDITIYSGDQLRELWVDSGSGVRMIERWDNDSLQIERYLPLELNRQGRTKVFYYIGGMLNGGKGYLNISTNLRLGTYLYKNLVDASVTMNIGHNRTDEDSKFAGDLGIDSRVYLPFRIKKVNLAPYAGAGISWSFAPESYFELRLLAGGCWFVGPGSLDIGLQYGIKSDFSAMLGYTFRVPYQKKHKKK